MILTDYYKLRELKLVKSHRLDCVSSTGEYEPFEYIAKRSKDKHFFLYYNGIPETFNCDARRKADRAITNGSNISCVYVPNLLHPLYGYGDTKDTNDALLFLFSEGYKQLEIFVARGQKHNQRQLFDLFLDNELEEEINLLRKQASSIYDVQAID